MNTKMLRMARKLWSNDMVPDEVNRANARKWIKSIRFLGDKWKLANYWTKEDHIRRSA